MKKNAKVILVSILIAAALAALLFFTWWNSRIPMNPPGTVGNTAGNLNNGGFFCEYGGKVYFSNAYDGGSLYSMDPAEGSIRKLNSVQVRNILAGGKYLYYFQLGASGEAGFGAVRSSKSFNRCGLNGKNAVGLTRDVVVTAQLVDNYLYMLTADKPTPKFYKLKIDKSDQLPLAGYAINPACAVNGVIYYNGTRDDHYLYTLDTATDVSSVAWEGNLWYPVVEGDYVYYMDVANDYRLCRYSFSRDLIEVLTDDRVDCFNVGNGYIYYQQNSGTAPQLKCMRTDGSGVLTVAEGNYSNINMTSRYVYFQAYGNETSLYHSPLGTAQYSAFDAARLAAEQAK